MFHSEYNTQQGALNGMEFDPHTLTQDPICTGASVLGIVFDGGVAIAADTRASYGKMARYRSISRLFKVNERTIIGMGGDYADYQYLQNVIENKVAELACYDPEAILSPLALHSWLTAVLYNRRSKMDPLWNNYIIGGLSGPDKKPYLGTVNKIGVAYTNPYIATGLGSYIIQQTLENAVQEKQKQGQALSRDNAVALLEQCIEILYMRDCYAHNQFEIGIVTERGCEILPPKKVKGNWEAAKLIRGYE